MALAFNDELPTKAIIWSMAEKFGWSIEYIKGMNLADIQDYLQIEHGRNKAAEHIKGRK